jgi:hypothetical protein
MLDQSEADVKEPRRAPEEDALATWLEAVPMYLEVPGGGRTRQTVDRRSAGVVQPRSAWK